jgi:putative transposase
LCNSPGSPIWQRSYYEHIIRDTDDYNRIAGYIADNPRRWADDHNNPDNLPSPRIAQPG